MEKMYVRIFALLLVLSSLSVSAQVGIGTTTPDSQLDVRATNQAAPANNDGLLIPKVDAFPLTNPTAAQQGMLVYLTTAVSFLSTTRQPGFYYWNNPSSDWIGISSSMNGDHDWYEEGTTTAPDAITDDMFHTGNVAIGKITADYPLEVETTTAFKAFNNFLNTSTAGTEKLAVENTVSGSSNDAHYGIRTTVNSSGTGNNFGIRNNMTGVGSGIHIGTMNDFNNTGTGTLWGTYNRINNANNAFHYGTFNDLFGDGGEKVGVRNLISGNTSSIDKGVENLMNGSGSATQMGTFNTIGNTGNGVHYGTYNTISNFGSGARYGSYNDMAATGAGNHYGTYNLLSGNGVSSLTQYGTSNNITKTGTATHIGTENILGGFGNGTKYGEVTTLSGPGTGMQYGNQINIVNSGNATHYGAEYNLNGSGTGARYGISTTITNATGSDHFGIISRLNGGGAGTRWGTYNTIGGAGTGQQTAVYNQLNGSGTGTNHGVFSQLSGSGAGQKYGIRNELTGEGSQFGGYFLLGGSGTGVQTGLTNEISNSSGSSHYGIVNTLSGTGAGTKMGMYSLVTTTAGGTHYGVYSEVLKAGANNFAGYFLGNVGIGTTIGNTYTFPPSRGTNNQIMVTNGTGVVTWQNASAIQDHDWYEVGTTTAPDAITDNMFHTGNVAIGKNVANFALDITSANRTINSTSTAAGTAAIYGVNSTAAGAGSGGHGVFGQTSQTLSAGVRGEQLGTAGNGVLGVNFGATGAGTGSGVYAQTQQSQGFGVVAYNVNASGTAVLGTGNNTTANYLVAGSGGAFNGFTTGIMARSTTAGVSTAVYSENFGVPNRVNYYDGATMYKILGTGTVSTTAEAPNGERVVLHCTEAPEIYFEDYGQGQLVNGRVHIDIDPIIAKNITVNERHPLRVFIQLEDECNGVFVTNKTGNSFDVVELAQGQSNAKFQYRIVGNRADEVLPGGRISKNADIRFEKAPGLETSKTATQAVENPTR
jgi:hypothetical protein